MSDHELRQILLDVIDDLDRGRVRLPGRRQPWRRAAGALVLSAGIGLGLGGLSGCHDRAIGTDQDATTEDATVRPDAGPVVPYGQPFLDGGEVTLYSEPFLDGGPMPPYSQPFLDGGSQEDYAAPPLDGGGDYLYSVPRVDAGQEVDGGNDSLYSAPAYMAPPFPGPGPS